MTQPQGEGPEQLLASLLVAYDEALGSHTPPPEVDESAFGDGDVAQRFRQAKKCLDLLDRVRRLDDRTSTPVVGKAETLRVDDPSAPRLPRSIGRFQIERELGRGGLGVVLLGKDPQAGRYVAIKIPRVEMISGGELERRFLREAEAAARLSHPNLVALYEVGREGSICYLVSEYCSGPTLAQWLQRHPAGADAPA